jgi:hypothetical protein
MDEEIAKNCENSCKLDRVMTFCENVSWYAIAV